MTGSGQGFDKDGLGGSALTPVLILRARRANRRLAELAPRGAKCVFSLAHWMFFRGFSTVNQKESKPYI